MRRVEFSCSLSRTGTPLPHFWEHTIGSGHAPLALRADWQAQLRRCHNELGFRYVRFHGLLSEHMGTLVAHKKGLLYSFFNVDQVVDFILSIGMKPFVELSFMPKAIASGDTTVFNYQANVTPPLWKTRQSGHQRYASYRRTIAYAWNGRLVAFAKPVVKQRGDLPDGEFFIGAVGLETHRCVG